MLSQTRVTAGQRWSYAEKKKKTYGNFYYFTTFLPVIPCWLSLSIQLLPPLPISLFHSRPLQVSLYCLIHGINNWEHFYAESEFWCPKLFGHGSMALMLVGRPVWGPALGAQARAHLSGWLAKLPTPGPWAMMHMADTQALRMHVATKFRVETEIFLATTWLICRGWGEGGHSINRMFLFVFSPLAI